MLPEHLMRWSTDETQRSLADRLGLPHDPLMQDWELQVADPSRIDEFLMAYRVESLSVDERFALMEILIASIDEIETSEIEELPAWREVESWLKASPELHAITVHYWSHLDDSRPEYCFRVTRPMRRVWAEIQPALREFQVPESILSPGS